MSDQPQGHPDPERFLKSVPTHLELLHKAKAELEENPTEARATLRRFSSFIVEEAERLGLSDVSGTARVLAERDSAPLLSDLLALEAALRGLLPPETNTQILVIEDEEGSASLAQNALAANDRTIHVTGTAARARAYLTEHSVDLVVLDLVLPDADGRHLLMELGRDVDAKPTKVIVVTAKGTPTTRAECFAYGASAFLEKPLDPETLNRVAADVLKRAAPDSDRSGSVSELPNPDELSDAFVRLQAHRSETKAPFVLALVETDPGGEGWDEEGRVPSELQALHAEVTTALQDVISPGDMVGRWGVSELVVLLSGREPEACVRVLERARARVDRSGRIFVAGLAEVGEGALFEDAVSWASRLVSEARMSAEGEILHTTLAKGRAPFVVVVEDDPITASLVRHRLERSGFEVEHHENGLRGLEAIRRALPDLVVLDIRLPGMDGFEILSRMSEEGVTESVRTVVLTGLGREADVARAFSLGADDYLVKPFSPVELTARALRLVRR